MVKKIARERVSHYIRAVPTLLRMLGRQRMERQRLRSLQERNLRRLVHHAYQTVPFYTELMTRAGIRPEDVNTLEDLSQFPISTKADLRNHSGELTARGTDRSRCLPITTSGSTGEPLTILWDDSALLKFYGTSARAHRILGGKLKDRILSVGPRYYPDRLFVQKIGIGRVRLESPFQSADQLLQIHNTYKPEVLLCYPSVLKCLFPFCESDSVTPHQPRLLLTSGEFLDDHTSERAKLHFGSRPFQFYGSWEMGRIANQCLNGEGLHLNEDICIAQFAPADPTLGADCHRLILTNLYNFTMPFIRYDQGDLVKVLRDPCPCGQSFIRIKLMEARPSEVIRLPDGTSVSALRFTGLIFDLPGINQFKYIQESPNSLFIQVVKRPEYRQDAADQLIAKMECLLPGMRIRIEIVPRIDPNPRGKTTQFETKDAESWEVES